MENYKSLYLMVFNQLTDLRGQIDAIQRAAEEYIISDGEGQPQAEAEKE